MLQVFFFLQNANVVKSMHSLTGCVNYGMCHASVSVCHKLWHAFYGDYVKCCITVHVYCLISPQISHVMMPLPNIDIPLTNACANRNVWDNFDTKNQGHRSNGLALRLLTDRQTDGRTDGRTNIQTDRQTHTQTERQLRFYDLDRWRGR